MDDHTYRIIELTGTSAASFEEAIKSAVARANQTTRNLRWFEVVRSSGRIDDGKVVQFQVTLKVAFTVEDAG